MVSLHAPAVQRYCGEDLGTTPHIAVLGSCKVGNFVVTLPLLSLLNRRYPMAVVDFWGSEATADFEQSLCGSTGPLDWRISWDQDRDDCFLHLAAACEQRRQEAGQIDLLINCDGFNPLTQVLASWLRPRYVAGGALTRNSRRDMAWGDAPQQRFLADHDWNSPAFVERYAGLFKSHYIAELLCRLAYLDPTPADLASIQLPDQPPGFAVPSVLIHCTTTRSAKIWPFERWAEVLHWCSNHGFMVGLVGAPANRQVEEYHAGSGEAGLLQQFSGPSQPLVDLRGRTSLIQLAGACRQARAVVSVDAGPLHIAAAVGTPTLAVVGNDADGVGASPIRLWMPRAHQLQRTVSTQTCTGCDDQRFRNEGCVADRHYCMEGVSSQQVITWLQTVLAA